MILLSTMFTEWWAVQVPVGTIGFSVGKIRVKWRCLMLTLHTKEIKNGTGPDRERQLQFGAIPPAVKHIHSPKGEKIDN